MIVEPAAAGVPLSDLYGYSVNAEWTIQEIDTNSQQPKPHVSTKHFADKIYISIKGRLFFAGSKIINMENRGSYAWLNSEQGDPVVYQRAAGFILREIPSDIRRSETTFARVTTISVRRTEGGFSCEVSARLVLKEGATEYIFYSNYGGEREYRIHSFNVISSECSVSVGNALDAR
jgi:hypothetical protein